MPLNQRYSAPIYFGDINIMSFLADFTLERK